jgi:hypothetical protein
VAVPYRSPALPRGRPAIGPAPFGKVKLCSQISLPA